MFGILKFGFGCDFIPIISLENIPDPANDFRIYPNPASNVVTFKNLSGVTSMEIVNLVGQTVSAIKVENDMEVVDVTDFAPGTYFVIINTTEESVTEKLIIY